VSAGFDFPAFAEAVETKDVPRWLDFYADDAEWLEYKPTAPPSAPVRMAGRETIHRFLSAVSSSEVRLEVGDEVVGPERAAFRITCTLPDGRRILEHVIVHLRDGRIVRQVEVEAWD
jgi:ketosteroid isomerase-like protein